ncbi:MAG: hypothetical protein LBN97_01420 [Oscillospiraceae bacterium]|jgi:hypothetical protein|nr:hypothetical protein [Oscillospiraceae bacterium]
MTSTLAAIDLTNEQFYAHVKSILMTFASTKDKSKAEKAVLMLLPEKQRAELAPVLAELHEDSNNLGR